MKHGVLQGKENVCLEMQFYQVEFGLPVKKRTFLGVMYLVVVFIREEINMELDGVRTKNQIFLFVKVPAVSTVVLRHWEKRY